MINTTFLDELASKAPTPGGGGASAYCGALAAALASMVGNLTVGKKTYAQVEGEISTCLTQLDTERAALLALIDEDARAFEPLAQAYALPKATPQEQAHKQAVMQQALVGAIEVPLRIMEACARVIALTDVMAHKGSRLAISDAGAAALLAQAALKSASLNIVINAASLANRAQAQAYLRRVDDLVYRAGTQAEETYAYVMEQLAGDQPSGASKGGQSTADQPAIGQPIADQPTATEKEAK